MIRTFAEGPKLMWIDVLGPTPEELRSIATQHSIHDAFVADVLQPEHLPKYEPVGSTSFFILRYYGATENEPVDTIQGLTNKIAIFHTETLVITIHRLEVAFINDLKKNLVEPGLCRSTFHLLNRLIKGVFFSYEAPAHKLAAEIDQCEAQTLLKQNHPPSLKGLYLAKRKIEVCRKLLILSKDILEKVDDPAHQDPDTRDTRDLYVRILTLFESMSDNTNHLLTLYFSISSQRTNEVIRVLTLFSVFFMPLTFIAGIYGMNFDFMPELRWKLGYPGIILVMIIITAIIYIWFRGKHWL